MILLMGEVSSKNFISRKFGATKRIIVGRIIPPHLQGDHILAPRTYGYITTRGTNDFANVGYQGF